MVPYAGGGTGNMVVKHYICDPQRNTACRKELCFERGGPCGITDRPEFALRDLTGQPVEILEEGDRNGQDKRQ